MTFLLCWLLLFFFFFCLWRIVLQSLIHYFWAAAFSNSALFSLSKGFAKSFILWTITLVSNAVVPIDFSLRSHHSFCWPPPLYFAMSVCRCNGVAWTTQLLAVHLLRQVCHECWWIFRITLHLRFHLPMMAWTLSFVTSSAPSAWILFSQLLWIWMVCFFFVTSLLP